MGLLHKVGSEWPNDCLPTWCSFSPQEVRYFMGMAKAVMESENPCPSRKIGAVIADPRTGALVSTGHNGPPDGAPPCDDEGYLRDVFWPQLKPHEKATALKKTMHPEEIDECDDYDQYLPNFLACNAGCGNVCPRKLIDAPSGQRLDLCTCAHGETNAIIRAHRSVAGCYMFCYCGVPCIDCTKLVINSRIYSVVVIDHGRGDYSPYSSRWLFEHSKTNVLFLSEEWLAKKN
jgi:deoxycytidylate deaminase